MLTGDQLEAVRMLTSHDLDSGSPLTVLLIGQPTLRRRLRVSDMAALDQRVQLKYAFPAPSLTTAEADGYIRAHLAHAGRTDTLFSDDAVRVIHSHARGLPRAINRLATTARCSPPAPRTRPSPTRKPPAPPSPRKPPTRQTDHHHDTASTTAPPGTRRTGPFSPLPQPP